ncbi:Arachidonate 12-lipoxygenase, epidermal-type [Nymphon striatum]|nr:Arachidonate 12-lipoxygenase, epidermal-type [Nymphon striatum]
MYTPISQAEENPSSLSCNNLQSVCQVELNPTEYSNCSSELWKNIKIQFGREDEEHEYPVTDFCLSDQRIFEAEVPDAKPLLSGNIGIRLIDTGGQLVPDFKELILESILIECSNSKGEKDSTSIGIRRVIDSGRLYKFLKHDTGLLPHPYFFDNQRDHELAAQKSMYSRAPMFGFGPLMLKKLTAQEKYEQLLQDKIQDPAVVLINIAGALKLGGITDPEFSSLQEMEDFWNGVGEPFHVPMVRNYWDSDAYFAAQRLQGSNPVVIKRLKYFPERFKPDFERIENLLGGKSVHKAKHEKRLFILDLEVLDGVDQLWAPFALFYLKNNGKLRPLAIQPTRDRPDNIVRGSGSSKLGRLEQTSRDWMPHNNGNGGIYKSTSDTVQGKMLTSSNLLLDIENDVSIKNYPEPYVFYPDDPPNAWRLAKMYYNGMESIHHQIKTHFDNSHLFVDNAAILLYRHVSPSHPIHKLLKPHFFMMFGNNLKGQSAIFGQGRFLDRIMTGGRLPGQVVAAKEGFKLTYKELNPVVNNLVREIQSIKVYPYRDRSIPLYYAIRSYVQEILENYYHRHKDVAKDSEIQTWRTMLEKSMVYGGAGIQHLPGSSKGSMNLNDLVDIVTTVLFQATAYHSAVNGGMFDNYGIPANYPFGLRKPPPTTKDISEQDILDSLPNKFTTFDTGVIMTILGLEMGNFLVEMERYLLHSPEDMMARENFQSVCQVELTPTEYSNCSSEFWKNIKIQFGREDEEHEYPVTDFCLSDQRIFEAEVPDANPLLSGNIGIRLIDTGGQLVPDFKELILESILIECSNSKGEKDSTSIGIRRVIDSGRLYTFLKHDTRLLPHPYFFDNQRDHELAAQKAMYSRSPMFGFGPLMLKKLTTQEKYELILLENIQNPVAVLINIAGGLKLGGITDPEFSSLQEMEDFWNGVGEPFHVPMIRNYWDSDAYFAAQRLQGSNPVGKKLANNSPVSQYWSIVLQLELLLNVFVLSLRQESFTMYLDALTELACWFHAMDHMNYARWIPVHLKDMAELPERYPEVARKFREGSFTVQKTKKIFSSIAIDQAHELNNACIKGDGGAVGLTNNPAALRRWMIAGPEVARVIEELH